MIYENRTRYEKLGLGMKVSLPDTNGMEVIAMTNRLCRDSNEYDITFMIGRRDVQKYDLMSEKITLSSANINTDTYNLIMDKHKDGFFTGAIKRYECELAMLESAINMDMTA